MSTHHHEAGHHLAHCKECDRFFDVRSGCPADIREDERQRIRSEVAALRRISNRLALEHAGSGDLAIIQQDLDESIERLATRLDKESDQLHAT